MEAIYGVSIMKFSIKNFKSPFLLPVLAAAGLLIYLGVRLIDWSDKVTLRFTIIQDRDIYEESDYGEPPQIAIWLEDTFTGNPRTVYVTRRTARGDFEGKVECPVSLPIWIGTFRREFHRDDFPTLRDPAPAAITRATRKKKRITARVRVPPSSCWRYFIEMNVAGDYNFTYTRMSDRYKPDYHGNGQPSIVYTGVITAEAGNTSYPELIGRSRQHQFTTEIIRDLKGIHSAGEVFKAIEVTCLD